MLIGTWNLAAKKSQVKAHAEFLAAQNCDVWLLTEVTPGFELPGYTLHTTAGTMGQGQFWAGVLSRLPAQQLAEPHPASAAVNIAGYVFCSSVLPWRSCGGSSPWKGHNTGERTRNAVNDLLSELPASRTVWGGDWNHTLTGAFPASNAGRSAILGAFDTLGLDCPTAASPHHLPELTAIDHIAVPTGTSIGSARHIPVGNLSDHDAYVVEVSIV